MPYLLRYGDIEFGSHFEKWPSPRYAQFLKFPPSRILKPYVYITQINSQTSIPPKCLRAYRAGPGLKQTQRLQKIQNWAARLIDGAMRYSHATPLLKKLHWLPIAVRVEFKILLLIHRALNGQAPVYIGHCVSRRQPVRSLRSSEHCLLCVPRTRRHWGDRAFQRSSPKPMERTTALSDIVIYDHCCI